MSKKAVSHILYIAATTCGLWSILGFRMLYVAASLQESHSESENKWRRLDTEDKTLYTICLYSTSHIQYWDMSRNVHNM